MTRKEALLDPRPSRGSLAPSARWTTCVPGWEGSRVEQTRPVIGVLRGEGIGPEVVAGALAVLHAVSTSAGLDVQVQEADFELGSGRKRSGLSDRVAEFCDTVFAAGGAMLCGAVGGRFVYDLRARFDLYCKLVPLRPSQALTDATIVRPERLDHIDVLLVRENVGGLYFGKFGRRNGGRIAYQNLSYSAGQVARIVAVAVALARQRRGKLAVVVKRGGIPEVSGLWSEQVTAAAGRDVAVEILDIDNASFQLVANANTFDVIVAPNLFGDVLADAAAVLLASRGMSYSANFGPAGRAVYQTGHGAAHDLAGSDRANPVAQILSLAMMFRESFGLDAVASTIETAIERVLASGLRTRDIAGPTSRVVGTAALAARIADEAAMLLSMCADAS